MMPRMSRIRKISTMPNSAPQPGTLMPRLRKSIPPKTAPVTPAANPEKKPLFVPEAGLEAVGKKGG